MPQTAEYPAANIPGAALRFPAEQFVTLPNVPVFREHKTRAVDGRMLEFGMQQLQMVANRCNRRIAETGDYAAYRAGNNQRMLPPNRCYYEKVAVIGAGVAGLTAAHDLALLGYRVTVFERDAVPGAARRCFVNRRRRFGGAVRRVA